MASVTGRIKEIKQPRGGFLNPSEFEIIDLNDGLILNGEENLHSSIIGMVVDYLSRFISEENIEKAFKISIIGANNANCYIEDAINIAKDLLYGIKGLDDNSIINACKLVTFDVWYRNPSIAPEAKKYSEINPDKKTIQNIKILVNRSLIFFEKYGPILENGFTFKSENNNSFGGYTEIVNNGDGDFITRDTIWDFKVSKSKPKSNDTLQLIMYWIMGQHSGRKIFKNISKIGIFNPRLNNIYIYMIYLNFQKMLFQK